MVAFRIRIREMVLGVWGLLLSTISATLSLGYVGCLSATYYLVLLLRPSVSICPGLGQNYTYSIVTTIANRESRFTNVRLAPGSPITT